MGKDSRLNFPRKARVVGVGRASLLPEYGEILIFPTNSREDRILRWI